MHHRRVTALVSKSVLQKKITTFFNVLIYKAGPKIIAQMFFSPFVSLKCRELEESMNFRSVQLPIPSSPN